MDIQSKFSRSGRLIALFSFLIGIFIFLLYYFNANNEILFIGYAYIIIAFIINLLIFLLLLIEVIKDKDYRKSSLKTICFMMLNLPVMLVLIFFTAFLMDTVRLTLINSTNQRLENIRVIGCEEVVIDNLDIGEEKEVWLNVQSDCFVRVKYLKNRTEKSFDVLSYVTSSDGIKLNFELK